MRKTNENINFAFIQVKWTIKGKKQIIATKHFEDNKNGLIRWGEGRGNPWAQRKILG